jgi:hypothetical protein
MKILGGDFMFKKKLSGILPKGGYLVARFDYKFLGITFVSVEKIINL